MALDLLIVESGPAKVLASGEATTFAGNGLVFKLLVDGVRARVDLAFQSEPAIEGVAVRTEDLDDGYRLTCVNFDSADGRGSSQPVLVAQIGETLLYLHFRVFLFGKTADRTVHYTFFQVPVDAVD